MPSRFFQEESEETITVADIEIGDDEEPKDDKQPTEPEKETEIPEEKATDEPKADESDYDVNNVDLGKFGTDTSDVQNEYDPKEIEILMKLMASEADAMNEYMDGAKDTNVDVLRRLYADIANEERFHMEQLLYAKCELTGEKYEPKDPEVKSEYEELLAMGMDEESAMHAAADKFHLRGQSEIESDEDAEEIMEDIKVTEMALMTMTAKLDDFLAVAESHSYRDEEMQKAITVFMEDATLENPRGNYDLNHGGIIGMLKSALRGILRLLGKLIRKFGNLLSWIRGKRNKYKMMYERNGKSWSILLKNGVKFYLINPKSYKGDYIDDSVYTYISVVKKMAILCGKQVSDLTGVQFAGLNGVDDVYLKKIGSKLDNIHDGIRILEHTQLNQIKYDIDQSAESMLDDIFFGYSKEKIGIGNANHSYNVYNALRAVHEHWESIGGYLDRIMDAMKDVKSQQQNRERYKEALDGIKVCIRTAKGFSSALSSDIAELARINTAMINETQELDMKDQRPKK